MPRAGRNPRENVVDLGPPERDGDIVVNLRDHMPPPRFRIQGGQAYEDTSPFQPEAPEEGAASAHDENLAETLDPQYLQQLGMETVELVEQDISDRAPWRERFERGMEMLGLVESDIDDGPFPGASNVVHPLILDAVVQFWARACAEFLPPEGPVKAKLMGAAKQSMQIVERADRVVEFMNFDLTCGDQGFVNDKSRLFWSLPIQGSAATKTFRDPVTAQVTGIYVPANDLIVHSSCGDLRTTPRFTHRMRKTLNELRALQLAGYYLDIPLDAPSDEDVDSVETVKNEIEDTAPSGINDEDNRLTLYETLRELDLPGHEHAIDGKPTGYALPYYVTVDKDSEQVLSVRRAWRENDPRYVRRLYFRKYDFIPGPGSYGLGFFHFIGGLQAAATGALRVMLDSAASASLSGGFVSKNATLKGERLISEPGVWTPVNSSAQDLKDAFFPLPVKEPSPALYNMLQFITDLGRKFSATTEMMTGDTDGKNTPVGTTLAMLEQGQKVMSTIHRLIHAEFARELKDRYELYAENAPEEGYPYEIGGDEKAVYAEDFAHYGYEIVPVSDPNIFSNVQRLQVAQAVWAEAKENPDVFDKKAAGRRLLASMKVPDPDELIKPDPEAMVYDSVGEIQAIILGKPVKVVPEQDHVAHLKALWAFASNPEYAGNPHIMEQIAPHLMSVTAQHVAYAWAANARQQGVPAGFMDPETGQMSQPEIPPEQVTQLMAMIAPNMVQAPGLPGIEQDGDKGGAELEAAKVEGEKQKLTLKAEEHQQEMAMERQRMEWEREREQLKIELEKYKAEAKVATENMKAQAQQQAIQQKAAADTQMQQQQMANDQAAMQQEAEMNQQRMGMEQEQMQREGQMKEAQMGQEMQHAERKSRLDELRRPAGGQDQGGMQ